MEKLSSLLFELSSSDRLDILQLLKKSPLNLSHISAKLDFTVQEASRNLARLSDAKLIVKDVDGTFHLTPFGEEALNMLKGYSFLSKNREYLLHHSASLLPETFRASLSILDNFTYVNDIMIAFHDVEKMIERAEKLVWIMTNQILVSTIPYLVQELERGGEFRLLMPKNYQMSNEMLQSTSHPIFEKALRGKKLDMRFLDKVDFFLCMSEKEVGAFAFPNVEGKPDYSGSFRAEGHSAVEWAKGLFMHYWQKSSDEFPHRMVDH